MVAVHFRWPVSPGAALANYDRRRKMNKKLLYISPGLCGLMFALCSFPSGAQQSEIKEKPPMYTYVADWQIPRAHWADMAKANSADNAILEKALGDGTIV